MNELNINTDSVSQTPVSSNTTSGRNSPNMDSVIDAIEEVTLIQREKESYTSFGVLAEVDEKIEAYERTNLDCRNSKTKEIEMQNPDLNIEDRLYSNFTTETRNLYYGAGDDPLLLDCTNFIHFELDKDKVVVFDIASAFTKNLEILKQYAISMPRSDNLPNQEY